MEPKNVTYYFMLNLILKLVFYVIKKNYWFKVCLFLFSSLEAFLLPLHFSKGRMTMDCRRKKKHVKKIQPNMAFGPWVNELCAHLLFQNYFCKYEKEIM
jgi:hypothetical protein